jgi:tetrahedral aminopeptidase
MDLMEVLKELNTYTAVSGYEKELSQHIQRLFEVECDDVHIDSFYNVIGLKKGNGKFKILITAHIDEVGFLVKSIDEKGFVKLSSLGGIDNKILLASEVILHGRREIPGVIGAKPPHLLKPEDAKKAVKLEDLSVDTGMKAEELKEYVSVGDIVTLKTKTGALQGGKVCARALDNRGGLLAMLEMMKEVSRYKTEADLYFAATTQEERELAGVRAAAFGIEPDFAIVIDAGHGDIPDVSRDVVFPLGKGPAIGIGPNLHKKLAKRLIELAKEEAIPHQIDVEPGDTGTEAWATQVTKSGIASVLVSIPVRYMHTPVETAHLTDIRNTARLLARFVSLQTVEMEEILCY